VKETCHNKKKEEPIVFAVPTKVVKLVVEMITQPVKPTRVPLKYRCIIYFNFKNHASDCSRKVKIQNMLWTKPTTTPNVVAKNLKLDNVPIHVVVDVMTSNQIPVQ
jgi:hypothetical protein